MDGSPDITLFRGWEDYGKYVWSPYVTKVEVRLRFAGVRYGVDSGSPRTAPRGKIPYVEYRPPPPPSSGTSRSASQEPALLSDSTLIIKTLTKCDVVPDLNAGLAAEDRATDLALRALLEDKLYYYHVSP